MNCSCLGIFAPEPYLLIRLILSFTCKSKVIKIIRKENKHQKQSVLMINMEILIKYDENKKANIRVIVKKRSNLNILKLIKAR